MYIYICIYSFIYVYVYIYILILYICTHIFVYIYIHVYCKNASSHIHISGSTRTTVDAISVAWAAHEPQEQDVVGLSHLPLTSVLVRAGIEADPTWISCYLGGKSEHCGAAAKCQGHWGAVQGSATSCNIYMHIHIWIYMYANIYIYIYIHTYSR